MEELKELIKILTLKLINELTNQINKKYDGKYECTINVNDEDNNSHTITEIETFRDGTIVIKLNGCRTLFFDPKFDFDNFLNRRVDKYLLQITNQFIEKEKNKNIK